MGPCVRGIHHHAAHLLQEYFGPLESVSAKNLQLDSKRFMLVIPHGGHTTVPYALLHIYS